MSGAINVAAKARVYRQGMSFKEANGRLIGLLDGNRDVMLRNDNDGEEARLSRTSIGKLVSNSAVQKSVNNGFTRRQHYAVVSDIDSLFKNSVKILSHPDKRGSSDIAAIHRFAAPLYIESAIVYITTKESKSHGKRMYTAELIKIEKLRGMLEEAGEGPLTHFPITDSSEKRSGGTLERAKNTLHNPLPPNHSKPMGILEVSGENSHTHFPTLSFPIGNTSNFHSSNISKLFNAVNTQNKNILNPNKKESL
ncbi:MAG: hypothetical protein LBU70_04910 [Chitinispirillales bacterium]|jgi:hypothetical protein|nr:hypothetical protein [Chitinispirillales bacterium]